MLVYILEKWKLHLTPIPFSCQYIDFIKGIIERGKFSPKKIFPLRQSWCKRNVRSMSSKYDFDRYPVQLYNIFEFIYFVW